MSVDKLTRKPLQFMGQLKSDLRSNAHEPFDGAEAGILKPNLFLPQILETRRVSFCILLEVCDRMKKVKL